MTAKPDLLPLRDWMECLGEINAEDIRDYARACVAHATAPLQAEIEALRAEVREAREFRDKMANAIGSDQLRRFIEKHGEPVPLTTRMQQAEARAERLAEALREIADQGPHYGPDGTYKTWRHWAEIARAALEQEEGHEQ